ncbi:MAG: hypothetical protein IJ728_10755 [Selenomonadaceae bacterium]|nr:hypothetical protein [Selenomonadaceae bacterium]
MATTLNNGVRTIQIKFSSGSMTVSKIKESVTSAQVATFANAVTAFTNKVLTGYVINDKESFNVNS